MCTKYRNICNICSVRCLRNLTQISGLTKKSRNLTFIHILLLVQALRYHCSCRCHDRTSFLCEGEFEEKCVLHFDAECYTVCERKILFSDNICCESCICILCSCIPHAGGTVPRAELVQMFADFEHQPSARDLVDAVTAEFYFTTEGSV